MTWSIEYKSALHSCIASWKMTLCRERRMHLERLLPIAMQKELLKNWKNLMWLQDQHNCLYCQYLIWQSVVSNLAKCSIIVQYLFIEYKAVSKVYRCTQTCRVLTLTAQRLNFVYVIFVLRVRAHAHLKVEPPLGILGYATGVVKSVSWTMTKACSTVSACSYINNIFQ